MRLIGLCGWARSGKDTAAEALISRGFARVAFADALKREVCSGLGIARERLEVEKASWRPLLVEWGRGRRRVDQDCWIKLTRALVEKMPPSADVVVTDVRYPNEAKWIWEQGGFVLRISRPGVIAANEEEERTIAEVDKIATRQTFWIENNGSVEDLHKKMEGVWLSL